jgi:hypothetical protein
VLTVDASAELDGRTVRLADFVASACIVHAACARAARAVVLAVDASTELDGRTVGETDSVSGSGIVLAVAGFGVMVTAEDGETRLFVVSW